MTPRPPTSARQNGSVLIAVLVVCLGLVAVTILFAHASMMNYRATQEQLTNLPGMTQDLAAAIVSWRGGTASAGSGSNTYSQRQPSYHEKQAPFDSIEELAMLDGSDPSVLASQDLNLNGVIDTYENDARAALNTLASGNPNGPGIWEYVTVFSQEPTTVPGSTTPRVAVKGFPSATNNGGTNGTTTSGKATTGTTTTSTSGTTSSSSSKTSGTGTTGTSGLATLLQQTFGDAQAAAITAIFRTQPATSVLDFFERSGLKAEDFQKIEKQLVTSLPTSGTSIQGLVNVNTAPREVLIALGMSDTEASSVISARQSNGAITGSNLTATGISWIKGVLQPPTITKVGPYLTGQSYIVSADVAAVGRLGRGYRRTRFVFDGRTGTPKLIYRRNLSAMGWALGRQVRDELTQERGRM